MSLFKRHADGRKSHSGIPGSSASDRVDAAMQAAELFAAVAIWIRSAMRHHLALDSRGYAQIALP
jgi:hypothetical protein